MAQVPRSRLVSHTLLGRLSMTGTRIPGQLNTVGPLSSNLRGAASINTTSPEAFLRRIVAIVDYRVPKPR